MNALAYIYDGSYHCLPCAHARFRGEETFVALDAAGDQVRPVNFWDEWPNPVPACTTCHRTINELEA